MLLGFQPAIAAEIAAKEYCVSIPPKVDTVPENKQYRNGITDYYRNMNEKENDNKIKIITNEHLNCKEKLLEIESYKPVKQKHKKIPIISVSHDETKRGNPYQFFLIPNDDKFTYTAISYMERRLGGKENLKGRTIMTLSSSDYDDDDYLNKLRKEYLFTYKSETIYDSDTKQNFIWPYISEHRPAFILLRGEGINIPLAIENATNFYYPVSKLIGHTWDDHSEDLEKLGEIADGYQKLSVFNFTTGKSTDDSNEKSANSSNSIYWKLGRLAALVSSKAIDFAVDEFYAGKFNPALNSGQVRWALENLNLSEDDLKEIGIENLAPPIKMDCNNHNIFSEIYIQRWDADKQGWDSIYDFTVPDKNDENEGKKCMGEELKVILDRSSDKKLDALNKLLKAEIKTLDYAYLPNITLTTQKDLTEADLTNATLTGAVLTNTILTGANLTGANLTGANLSRAILTEVNILGANLSKVNLSHATLTKVNLSGANLSEVKFSNTVLTEVDLSDAKEGAVGSSETRIDRELWLKLKTGNQ